MTDTTFSIAKFQHNDKTFKHIRIGIPNKKSSWRIVLQISGLIKSIALKNTTCAKALETLLPTLLSNKKDIIDASNKDTVSKDTLKQKYLKYLEGSLEKEQAKFVPLTTKAKSRTLQQWLFKPNGNTRYFKIREPYKNNKVHLSIAKGNIAKTLGLQEGSISQHVDNTFNEFLDSLPQIYDLNSIQIAKVLLKRKLEIQYEELCNSSSPEALNSKFNSIAGLFYKNGKFTGFSVKLDKRHSHAAYLSFAKTGNKSIKRSLDKHDFNSAFEEVFIFACNVQGVKADSSNMYMIKIQLKKHLLSEIKKLK